MKDERRDRLDFISGRSLADGVPADRVAIVAEGSVDLPAGRYELRTISDDGIRVWIDDDRVIDHWTPHESRSTRRALAAGRHRLKVEYFELGGFAELRVEILTTMITWLTDPQTWIAFATLTFLEIVLGVDNIIFISILAGRLPAGQQASARRIGLLLAMGTRILLLFSLTWIVGSRPRSSPCSVTSCRAGT